MGEEREWGEGSGWREEGREGEEGKEWMGWR